MSRQPHMSDAIGHRTVTDAAVASFGCLTGDYARMHFDLEFGRSTQRGGPIAHGLLSAAWALGALTLHAPERLALGRPEAWLEAFRIRFTKPVHIGDSFCLRWSEGAEASFAERSQGSKPLDTDFEILNQKGAVTCSGGIRVSLAEAGKPPVLPPPPEPLPIEPWRSDSVKAPLFADDMLALGPRGVSTGRTVSEADVVGYTGFTGELNPLYLNAEFARSGPFGVRIAPPMLGFCLGFGDFLRDLLRVPLPAVAFAGHLGDAWQAFAPVRLGDTIRVRHEPVACELSKSRPGSAVVQFALQLENQRGEIVQDGRVWMLMPVRASA